MIILPPSIKSVSVSVHPSYAMRGLPQMWPLIFRALARAREVALRGGLEDWSKRWKFTVPATPAEMEAHLEGATVVAIDLETPKDDSAVINMVGLSAKPWEAVCARWDYETMEVIRRLMVRKDILKLAHNAPFDWGRFLKNDLEIEWPVMDTMVAESLLRPAFKEAKKRRWHALSTCVQHQVSGWPYHKEPEHPFTKAWMRVAFPNIPEGWHEMIYCCIDAGGTRLMWPEQARQLRAEGML